MNNFGQQRRREFLDLKPLIVFDDPQREGEADLIFPAEIITPEIVTFMITYGKGLLCVGISQQRQQELKLDLLTQQNNTNFHTNFVMPVDYKPGLTTGISSQERAGTIRALGNSQITAQDFTRPGHVFPLRAESEGLAARRGHTEASVAIAGYTGFSPAGALIEILDEQGHNHNPEYIQWLANQFNLKITSVSEIAQELGLE